MRLHVSSLSGAVLLWPEAKVKASSRTGKSSLRLRSGIASSSPAPGNQSSGFPRARVPFHGRGSSSEFPRRRERESRKEEAFLIFRGRLESRGAACAGRGRRGRARLSCSPLRGNRADRGQRRRITGYVTTAGAPRAIVRRSALASADARRIDDDDICRLPARFASRASTVPGTKAALSIRLTRAFSTALAMFAAERRCGHLASRGRQRELDRPAAQ